MAEPISDEERRRRKKQSEAARARDAARRQAAQREAEAHAAKTRPRQEFHKCAVCGAKIRVEFKRCRRCSGIRTRPDVDALERRLPGSFGSKSG